ncbi:MAG TPA: 6,7-dimethyl-8-ribityllumazine synthase [Bacteroidales bacterium]|nr:6,7-dimethyl-8-ribityllumazine synthase [Bacteroidales bacterium]HOX75672.1 6,7-dimethyl-8-ribityllumazine synthase [Bacteroidales bacterium]HQM68728.1 6,7-dimethyl-8-ribityllumazine synthase [Bacteroidales bacterium]
MSTTDLSAYDPDTIPDAGSFKFGIVVADWNRDITHALLDGALKTLKKHGVRDQNIYIKHVPGTFELTFGGRLIAESTESDAVICLGCVIQGETPHFTYICQGVTQGITQLNLDYDIPFIFGVLTTETHQQAIDRSGGKYGNKGDEAAVTAIKMAALNNRTE